MKLQPHNGPGLMITSMTDEEYLGLIQKRMNGELAELDWFGWVAEKLMHKDHEVSFGNATPYDPSIDKTIMAMPGGFDKTPFCLLWMNGADCKCPKQCVRCQLESDDE